MRSCVVVLERSRILPKDQWRESGQQRTLAPIAIEKLINTAWSSGRSSNGQQGCVFLSVTADGSDVNEQSVQTLAGNRNALIAAFRIEYISADRVKVTLDEDACARLTGAPRRRTRQIALLRPWTPVRVLLNGRSATYSGQYYSLAEYHLVLCTEPEPAELEPTRLVDLQADLF